MQRTTLNFMVSFFRSSLVTEGEATLENVGDKEVGKKHKSEEVNIYQVCAAPVSGTHI